MFGFVLLEKGKVDDVLDSFALSKSLHLRWRLELDVLVSFHAGTGGGNIAAVGGGEERRLHGKTLTLSPPACKIEDIRLARS